MKYRFNYPISNFDILTFMKQKKIPFNDVIMRDEFNENTPYGNYIINLDDLQGPGSHWVAYIYTPNVSYYFDSFGIIPPSEIINYSKCSKLLYNNFIIQEKYSILCGWYCINFINYMMKSKTLNKEVYESFTHQFQNNEHVNDSIVISNILDI
jgi:hypothetical protein